MTKKTKHGNIPRIHPRDLEVLKYLASRRKPASLKKIADAFGKRPCDVRRNITRLVAMRYVRSVQNEDEKNSRKCSNFAVTPKGKRYLRYKYYALFQYHCNAYIINSNIYNSYINTLRNTLYIDCIFVDKGFTMYESEFDRHIVAENMLLNGVLQECSSCKYCLHCGCWDIYNHSREIGEYGVINYGKEFCNSRYHHTAVLYLLYSADLSQVKLKYEPREIYRRSENGKLLKEYSDASERFVPIDDAYESIKKIRKQIFYSPLFWVRESGGLIVKNTRIIWLQVPDKYVTGIIYRSIDHQKEDRTLENTLREFTNIGLVPSMIVYGNSKWDVYLFLHSPVSDIHRIERLINELHNRFVFEKDLNTIDNDVELDPTQVFLSLPGVSYGSRWMNARVVFLPYKKTLFSMRQIENALGLEDWNRVRGRKNKR